MRTILLSSALCLAATVACSSGDKAPAPEVKGTSGSVGGTCKDRPEAELYACAEEHFWTAFQQQGLEARLASEKDLLGVIEAVTAPTDKRGMSLMHFRLGQIRLALALENAQRDYVMKAGTMIVGEFDKASALDTYEGIIAPWKDTMEIATAAVLGDWELAGKLAQRGFDNVALNPMGNTLSLSGTTIGFPLRTGVPQKTVALLDVWKCKDVQWCTENSSHAPFARPGLSFHFAEAYARVGNREKALEYLDTALASPGAERWPYRSIAKAAHDDLDGYMKTFSSLGQDGSAFDIAYANQSYGCLFCHAK